MVQYICDKCYKQFTKKSNYISHCNKIRPCNDINNNINNINIGLVDKKLKLCINYKNEVEDMSKNVNIDNKNEMEEHNNFNLLQNNTIDEHKNKLYLCNYCNKTFTQSGTLKIHLLERCKIRREEIKKQENDNKKDNDIIKIVNELKEENNTLKKMIIELATNAKTNNTNNETITNNINYRTITNNDVSINKDIHFDGKNIKLQILVKM
jgi:hypothetical protein